MLASTLRSAGLQGSALQHSSRRSQAPLITAAGPRLAAWQGGALPRPSAARPLAARQQLAARQPARSRRGQLAVVAARGGGDNVDIADRVVSSLVYFMPLADGLRYGGWCLAVGPECRGRAAACERRAGRSALENTHLRGPVCQPCGSRATPGPPPAATLAAAGHAAPARCSLVI